MIVSTDDMTAQAAKSPLPLPRHLSLPLRALQNVSETYNHSWYVQEEDELENVPEADWTAFSAVGKQMARLTSTPFFSGGTARLLFTHACRVCP